MTIRAFITGLSDLQISNNERSFLREARPWGLILFERNISNPRQVAALVGEFKDILGFDAPVLIDQEGGRVQRFREGFTPIPPMRALGRFWDRERARALEAARAVGYTIAAELDAHGVDFSFAPVLDLDYGSSSVIGDRALHFDPGAVGALGAALVQGMSDAGAAAVAKHFPGHGFAALDSHVSVPRDERRIEEIMRKDVAPYRPVIAAGVKGIMPAHVVYPQADSEPAGYSRYWLQAVLRGELGFEGLIFSDDLSMEGASTAGGVPERAAAALAAGCDMVLLCRDPPGQDALLDALGPLQLARPERAERMQSRHGRDLRKSVAYREAAGMLESLA